MKGRYCLMCLLAAAMLLCCLVFGVAVAEEAQTTKIVIIANKTVTTDSISKKDLKKIFLGSKKTLAGGVRVFPVVLKSSDTHKTFLKTFIGKSDNAFQNYWKKLLFTGKSRMPQVFVSEEELIAFVNRTRGTIGYVSSRPATDGVITLEIKD